MTEKNVEYVGILIICVLCSPKDIANMKNEIEKRQKDEESQAAEGGEATTTVTENGAATEVAAGVEVQS